MGTDHESPLYRLQFENLGLYHSRLNKNAKVKSYDDDDDKRGKELTGYSTRSP